MAKQCITILSLTFKASGAVPAYRAVGFNGARASVQGQKVLGVSPRPVDDGQYSDAAAVGTAVIETGGAFTAGAGLVVDNQGRAIAEAGAEGEFVFADALDASGGAGSFAEVFLRR